MVRTTTLQDAEGIEGKPIDLDELRKRLRNRGERRREHYSSETGESVFQHLLAALERLRTENPVVATAAEYHYLSKASLRSIVLATGRTEEQCSEDLRLARAWVLRATKTAGG